MKKIISGLLVLMIGLFSVVVNAQGLGDLIDSLGSEINFGYTTTEKLTIKEITDQKVIIESPIIKNQSNENITKYTVMYSEFPLTEILEDTNLLNQTKEKSFDITGTNNSFTIELGTADGIDIIKKYYLFVIPKDINGNLGEVSNEIRFNIAEKTYGDAGSSEIYTTTAVHNAAGADMTLANITHGINGSTITLRWISINGSSTIDLSVMTPGSSSFNRVATINMNDESYSFVASRNGEYIFQFTPDNGGKQVNYTVQINTISSSAGGSPGGKVIPVVPKTGTEENILIISIIAFLGYIIYRKLYRKAK
ncbi:hypothetical protein P148_SR1C00001G0952 [candidate division SR1 bacterium RAAC1_SR1_1]|nr:hypothetical protein P148_SR1C00001G0952 [candidate division SR1 bacterium RAAC1_SR1_1]